MAKTGLSFSLLENLYKSELFVVIFLENFEFYIQRFGIILGPRNSSMLVLEFVKDHKIDTSELVQKSSSVVSHG